MRQLSASLIAVASAITFGPMALAADLPRKAPVALPPPAFSWTGFYVGANLGGAWGTSKYNYLADTTSWSPGNVALLNSDGSPNLHMSNVSGGGQIGYNWQINQIVLGAEADFQYIGLKETNRFTQTVSAPPASISVPYTFTKTSQADWLSTVRARVGYAWDRLLIYGTGGLAITESKSSDILSFNGDPNFTSTGSRSNVQLGWTAGGGLEWAFAARWSAKAEYLYARFPSKTTAKTTFIGNPVFFDAYTDRLTVNVARAGVNYRF